MKRIIVMMLVLCMLMPCLAAEAAPSKASQQEYVTESFAGEIIIPMKDAEQTERFGNWKTSTAVKGYDGKAHYWVSEAGAWVKFNVSGIKKGNYEVFYWVCPHSGNKIDKVPLTIKHAGKETQSYVYEKIGNEDVEPGWVSLGVFDFDGKGEEFVYYESETTGNVRASAVKVVPTKKELYDKGAAIEAEEQAIKEKELANAIYAEPYPGFKYVGNWVFSTAVPGPMVKAPSSIWIAGATEADYCEYHPDIQAAGDVRISVYLLYWHENQNPAVTYEVYHNGKKDVVTLDPTSITESQWVSLGVFDFAGTEEEYVKLVCVPSITEEGQKAKNTRASSVCFEIINKVNGDVWETVYVTPQAGLADLDRAEELRENLANFTDLEGHWAKYDVSYMASRNFIQGVAEGFFDPESTITRAEFVTILNRAMGFDEVKEDVFSDVLPSEWYHGYVGAASKYGLLKNLPVSEGFLPNQPIMREEMALLICNAIALNPKNIEWLSDMPDEYGKYEDVQSVSAFAKDALKLLVQAGIIKGTTDTMLSPGETATRAQAAVILKRFMQQFVWAGPPSDEEWELTFHDEFFGDSLNWDTWQSQAGASGHIDSSRWPENAVVKDGALNLMIWKEQRAEKEWTSGNVWVNPNVFRQSYGYWEARYKYAASGGINNAFWMHTSTGPHNLIAYNPGKTKFEIDINEGHFPSRINTNYHAPESNYSEKISTNYDLSADYHTYALEWTEKELIYYFDGEVISVKPNDNCEVAVYPMFSTAVLNWAGEISDAGHNTSMTIDYVRIWQKKGDTEGKTFVNDPLKKETAKQESDSPYPKVTVEEQVVDNEKKDGEIIIEAVLEGKWEKSSALKNHQGKAHFWTNEKDATSTYKLNGVKKGKYDVYFWRIPHQYNVAQMNFDLYTDGERKPFGAVALKTYDPAILAGWVKMGSFEHSGDADAFFQNVCDGKNCRADAVKLVPVKE